MHNFPLTRYLLSSSITCSSDQYPFTKHTECPTVGGTPVLDDIIDVGGSVESQLFQASPTHTDVTWLQQWSCLIATPAPPRVPLAACAIITPLISSVWRHLLISHPHRELLLFLLARSNPWLLHWLHWTTFYPKVCKAQYAVRVATFRGG